MDPGEVEGIVVSTHNLPDLQNYLVTFNKEIEGADPSAIVDGDAEIDCSGSVNDILASVSAARSVEGSGTGHFATAFYSEQSLLDSGLEEDSTQAIHSLVSGVEGEDADITQIKQESTGLDLEDSSMTTVQAHLASLTGSLSDMTSQELIMTAVHDSLDASEGKVIRILSLSQDGSILSLGDGSQMQIEGLQVGSEIKDLPVNLDGLEGQTLAMLCSGQDLMDSTSSTVSTPTATVTSAANPHLLPAPDHGLHDHPPDPSEVDLTQQLVAVQPLQSPDGLQTLTLGGDLTSEASPIVLNTGNTLQTLAIVPSEGQDGEVNYVLVVAQPDGANKDLGLQLDINSILGLKEENDQLAAEEFVQEDGTLKRILKLTPKKVFGASELTCNYCGYTSNKRYLLSRHMKSHSEDRPHKCDICQRGFKTLASLTNHVNTHSGIRPHKCKDCEAAFTTSGELVRHVRYRHTFEKPHKCPECDYASVELSKLKRHLRSHTGERPYQCNECSYASPDTYKLKRHMRIHTGEKPYACDICAARFTQSNSLKAHKLIHTGNKPVFQCQFCPTTCGRKTDLKIHVQKLHYSHEPVTCRKCGESFADRYTFKVHWKTHEGEKCFKCDQCDYSACSQRHLESHILTHSGQKPFECDECDHSFRQKQLLKRHKNHHHTADYQPPMPRDKSHDCFTCDKSFAHKGNLMRHLAQHGGEDLSEDDTASAGSGDGESGGLRTITADHVLHGDLMQDWREGKLGNAPQVVIVHPDGRIEEVTPKLQPAPERCVEGEICEGGEGGSGTGPSSSTDNETPSKATKNSAAQSPNQEQEEEDDGNQREAGTQVELASDSSEEDDDDDEEEEEGQEVAATAEPPLEDSEPVVSTEHFLTALSKAGDVSSLTSVLESSTVTLLPAGSGDLESMIASLPLMSAPESVSQLPSCSTDQAQIPTIDAPEILAHLDVTTKLIKQETNDAGYPDAQPSSSLTPDTTPTSACQTVSLPQSKAAGAAVSRQPTVLVVSPITSSAGAKGVTMVMGSSSKVAMVDRKTRSMQRKGEQDQASPAKRTRKAIAEQRYTYI